MRRAATVALAMMIVLAVMAGMCLIAGVEIASYPYPSYLLQAQAWLRGEAKLAQNYEFLELAVYNGNYYVSFPPVPSVPMVLWTLIFGNEVPGGLFQKIYVMIACGVILDALSRRRRISLPHCAAWAVLLCMGSAILPVSMVGAVWYEAQILAFLFCVSAIAALRRKRIVIACLCYALAVGCRPFSVLLGPVLLMLYLKMYRRLPAKQRFMRLLPGLIAGLCVAAAYGWYNYIRFGNPFEFGHNYLPEFVRAEHGQLSPAYLLENLKILLFRLPFSMVDGELHFNAFGFSMFLSCPVFICNLIWVVQDIRKGRFTAEKAVIVLMGALNVMMLCTHRTLGGYQFGARYAIELLPLSLCYLLTCPDRKRMKKWEAGLLVFGLIFNFAGGCLVHI